VVTAGVWAWVVGVVVVVAEEDGKCGPRWEWAWAASRPWQ